MCFFLAGVAELRGCLVADGGSDFSAVCRWKQFAARMGQLGNWSSASSGEFYTNPTFPPINISLNLSASFDQV